MAASTTTSSVPSSASSARSKSNGLSRRKGVGGNPGALFLWPTGYGHRFGRPPVPWLGPGRDRARTGLPAPDGRSGNAPIEAARSGLRPESDDGGAVSAGRSDRPTAVGAALRQAACRTHAGSPSHRDISDECASRSPSLACGTPLCRPPRFVDCESRPPHPRGRKKKGVAASTATPFDDTKLGRA